MVLQADAVDDRTLANAVGNHGRIGAAPRRVDVPRLLGGFVDDEFMLGEILPSALEAPFHQIILEEELGAPTALILPLVIPQQCLVNDLHAMDLTGIASGDLRKTLFQQTLDLCHVVVLDPSGRPLVVVQAMELRRDVLFPAVLQTKIGRRPAIDFLTVLGKPKRAGPGYAKYIFAGCFSRSYN